MNGPDGGDRLLGIELLRFASAVAVLVFHYQHFAFVGTAMPGFERSAQPFYGVLDTLYHHGHYGVQVFWCISGFIFYWKYAPRIAALRTGGHEFFVLRFSRLYPLHLLTLLFVAGVQLAYLELTQQHFVYANNDAFHFLLQLVFASNWGLQAGESFNGPIWSISIEVLVYVLFFLHMRFLGAGLLSLAAVLAAALVANLFDMSTHPVIYCILFFYAGCFTAVAYRATQEFAGLNRAATALALLLVLAMPVALLHTALRPMQFLFIYVPALAFLSARYLRPTGMRARLLANAGNMTYASYLLHVPLQITVCGVYAALGQSVPWQQPLMFVAYLLVILLLAHVCHRGFEMPMQALLRQWLLRPRSRAAGSGALG